MTRGYLLDTDWAIGLLRGRPATIVEAVRALPPDDLLISIISLPELYTGAFLSTNPDRFFGCHRCTPHPATGRQPRHGYLPPLRVTGC